jgi:hypothetical protein
MFNIDVYEKENAKIIENIKEKLPEWQTCQGFIADGLFDPKTYSEQKIKILFVLAEYYCHDKDKMIDIKSQIKENDRFFDFLGLKNKKYPNTKTVKTIAGLLYYLYDHYDEKSEKVCGYVKQDKELFKTRSKEKYFIQAQKCYSKCGMIDIKKDSATYNDIKFTKKKAEEAIRKYSDIIKKQIEIISPNLIIVCGNDIIDALKIIQNIPDELIEYPKKNKPPVVKKINDVYYAFVCHPTWWWNHDWLYMIYKGIVDGMTPQA